MKDEEKKDEEKTDEEKKEGEEEITEAAEADVSTTTAEKKTLMQKLMTIKRDLMANKKEEKVEEEKKEGEEETAEKEEGEEEVKAEGEEAAEGEAQDELGEEKPKPTNRIKKFFSMKRPRRTTETEEKVEEEKKEGEEEKKEGEEEKVAEEEVKEEVDAVVEVVEDPHPEGAAPGAHPHQPLHLRHPPQARVLAQVPWSQVRECGGEGQPAGRRPAAHAIQRFPGHPGCQAREGEHPARHGGPRREEPPIRHPLLAVHQPRQHHQGLQDEPADQPRQRHQGLQDEP